jgi:hypothetical protein
MGVKFVFHAETEGVWKQNAEMIVTYMGQEVKHAKFWMIDLIGKYHFEALGIGSIIILKCRIWSSHSGGYEVFCHLGYNTM